VKKLLKKFKMDDAKQMKTPIHPTTILGLDEESKQVDEKTYRGIIGSLFYLTASRPNIIFNVCLCAKLQTKPREGHISAIKRIFRYLIGTPNLGLCFKREKEHRLLGCCDVDFARNKVERKNTNRGCHFIGGCLVSWTSTKQGTIALLIAETKYISIASCCSQVLWIKHQLKDYNLFQRQFPILCDNTIAIDLSKNLIMHSCAKHITS